jgi:hypothetical protein
MTSDHMFQLSMALVALGGQIALVLIKRDRDRRQRADLSLQEETRCESARQDTAVSTMQ